MIDVFCTEDVKRKKGGVTYSKLLCEVVPVCLPKLCAKPFLFIAAQLCHLDLRSFCDPLISLFSLVCKNNILIEKQNRIERD